jgi:hypothetical protein
VRIAGRWRGRERKLRRGRTGQAVGETSLLLHWTSGRARVRGAFLLGYFWRAGGAGGEGGGGPGRLAQAAREGFRSERLSVLVRRRGPEGQRAENNSAPSFFKLRAAAAPTPCVPVADFPLEAERCGRAKI